MRVSERLNNKEVLKTNWYSGEKFDTVAEKAIKHQVKRLVLLMRCAELSGRMSLDKAERCVIRAMEEAEMLYYGMTEEEIKSLIEMEKNNDKRRKGNK